ncbi:MAG: ABC transporter substrate-binding protein [Candidatus Phaeomarinobacter sp.]
MTFRSMLQFGALVRGVAIATLTSVLAVGGAGAQEISEDQAVGLAEELHAGLVHLMGNGTDLGVDAASDYIGEVVDKTYNLKAITAQSIGPSTFRGYTREEQDSVASAYRSFVVANYVSRFAKPLPISFETVGSTAGPKGSVVVETQLIRKSGEPVQLVYVVAGSTPGIADVQYNGVSEAARRRSELSSLARQGADAIADALTKKAAQIAADIE